MITYKNRKIKNGFKSRFIEIREREGGCDSRGTDMYKEESYEIFTVGRMHFTSLKDAKRYIDSLENKEEIKKCINKYKRIQSKYKILHKNLYRLRTYLGKLGYDTHKLS